MKEYYVSLIRFSYASLMLPSINNPILLTHNIGELSHEEVSLFREAIHEIRGDCLREKECGLNCKSQANYNLVCPERISIWCCTIEKDPLRNLSYPTLFVNGNDYVVLLREVNAQRTIEELRSINRELENVKSVTTDSATGFVLQYCLDLANAVRVRQRSFHAVDEQPEDLEVLRDSLSKLSVRWISARKFSEQVDRDIGTLKNSRSKGPKTKDKLFGRGKDGYIWKQDKPNGHARYLEQKDYPK